MVGEVSEEPDEVATGQATGPMAVATNPVGSAASSMSVANAAGVAIGAHVFILSRPAGVLVPSRS